MPTGGTIKNIAQMLMRKSAPKEAKGVFNNSKQLDFSKKKNTVKHKSKLFHHCIVCYGSTLTWNDDFWSTLMRKKFRFPTTAV